MPVCRKADEYTMDIKKAFEPTREQCEAYLRQYQPQLTLGAYIDAGGAGVVYELEGLGEPCVVKFVDTRFFAQTCEDTQRLINCENYVNREIALMQSLKDCPHVMPLYGAFRCPQVSGPNPTGQGVSVTLLIMPKMDTVMQYIQKHDNLDVHQLALDMGEALDACFQQKILHRDLKLNNIFLQRQGGGLRFVLGDFGVGRRMEPLGTQSVTFVGTRPYIAPEFYSPEPLLYMNSDIYALGVSIFFLLSKGNFPPDGLSAYKGGYRYIKNWYQIDPLFRPFLEKATQPNPAHRYHTPQEMLDDLKKLCVVRRGSIIRDPMATAAKEALCRGDQKEALRLALEGCKKGEAPCRRLAAYCLYRQNPTDPRILELLDECFMEDDATGILIRGMYYAAIKDTKNASADIQDAAQNNSDCVPAWYYYGRFLYYGNYPGIPLDPSAGLEYLQKAAEHGFYPALRILKRIYQERPYYKIPASLVESLKQSYCAQDPREREDIIHYL